MPASQQIPITVVRLGPEVEDLVLQVLRSGSIAQGSLVERLEREFAGMIGVEHVVAVNNGTTALVAALQVLGIGPGDEVITSPFTFVATLNAIIQCGATARFADISADDFNVDPAAMTSLVGPRTAALLPVHLYGQCADMDAIDALTRAQGVALVEDAAQAHGARIGERAAGTWGTGCFSLYATKNLTSAEGGLVSTNDAAVADALRVLRNQGMRERYVYEVAGHNYRMTDLQAAVCLPQLPGYAGQVAARQRNAAALTSGLADVPGLRTPMVMAGRSHVWHQYTVLVEDGAAVDRDGLQVGLADAGIGSGVYYPRVVFDYDCYRSHPNVVADEVPVARDVATRCLSLPVHHHLSSSDVDRIIATVREVMRA